MYNRFVESYNLVKSSFKEIMNQTLLGLVYNYAVVIPSEFYRLNYKYPASVTYICRKCLMIIFEGSFPKTCVLFDTVH